jgi:hypothetical protein
VLAHENDILCAPAALGKTVAAAGLISARAVSALIRVHPGQLMDQWREKLAVYVALPIENIGQFGGARRAKERDGHRYLKVLGGVGVCRGSHEQSKQSQPSHISVPLLSAPECP